MEELGKVRRALGKRVPGAPHETWIVLDAAMGQNAITQARMFHEIAHLTGVVVAKLDGSAKAGFVFSILRELQVPIRLSAWARTWRTSRPSTRVPLWMPCWAMNHPTRRLAMAARPPRDERWMARALELARRAKA
jgi:hypothetical protein